MRMDFATGTHSFAFRPENEFEFQSLYSCRSSSQVFPSAEIVFSSLVCPCLPEVPDNSDEINGLTWSFPFLFSDKLSNAKGTVCHLDLTDNFPVQSRPYQISPRRLKILRPGPAE
jgi:hypothetical protein